MKKLLLFSLLSFVLYIGVSLAYTQVDMDNASFLGDKGIITKQLNAFGYRLDDTITRAEVVGISLKIKWVTLPEKYTCKNYFSDVKYDVVNNWKCRAVEIAADNGLVSRNNKIFRPQDRITRAEALSILIKAGSFSTKDIPGFEQGTEWVMSDATNKWQSEIFNIGFSLGIIDKEKLPRKENQWEMGGYIYSFYPNRDAIRAEVFWFARAIIEKQNRQTISLYYINENASGLLEWSVCDGWMRILIRSISIPKTVWILRATLLEQLKKENDPESIEFGPWNVTRMYRLELDKVNIVNNEASIYLKHDEQYLAHTTTQDRLAAMNAESGGMIFSETNKTCAIQEQITALAKQFPTVQSVKIYINNEPITS